MLWAKDLVHARVHPCRWEGRLPPAGLRFFPKPCADLSSTNRVKGALGFCNTEKNCSPSLLRNSLVEMRSWPNHIWIRWWEKDCLQKASTCICSIANMGLYRKGAI